MNTETLKKKAEQFHQRFDTELQGEYIRQSEYKGAHEPLTALHIPCGEIRTAAARDFFRKGCPICVRKAAAEKRANERSRGYIAEIEAAYNVTALTPYTGPRDPMKWKCNICGEVIDRPVEYILWRHEYGSGMQHDCFSVHKRLIKALKKRAYQLEKEEAREEAKTLHDSAMRASIQKLCDKYTENGYKIVKIYDDNQRVVVQHLMCGRKYTTSKYRMQKGYGCKECAKKGISFGVQQIMAYLDAHNIIYEREVCFASCKIDRPLPFDFILYDAHGQPTHAIEFNGEHHYKPIAYFGGDEKYEETQEADRKKSEWCKRRGIPLLFIRYDANVIDELNRFLDR